MGIPRERIRSRKPIKGWEEGVIPVEDWRSMNNAMSSVDACFNFAVSSIYLHSPANPEPPDPSYLAWDWERFRYAVESVADYLKKNKGKVPPRHQHSLDEIKKILIESSSYPVIPGSPWAEIRAILVKAGIPDFPN
jgi:hypothetical protein